MLHCVRLYCFQAGLLSLPFVCIVLDNFNSVNIHALVANFNGHSRPKLASYYNPTNDPVGKHVHEIHKSLCNHLCYIAKDNLLIVGWNINRQLRTNITNYG